MANAEHLALLKQGVEVWNIWKQENSRVWADLSDATFAGAILTGANLARADLANAGFTHARLSRANLILARLSRADLFRADLGGADLSGANLTAANLRRADLLGANLSYADLTDADLRGALLVGANLASARLRGTDLHEVTLRGTVLANINLSETKGLDSCHHRGPSIIDHRTLQRSGPLPLIFLRGCGVPDNLIDYLPSLLNPPIQFYSCFISYSSKDEEFAERLHADLQNRGIRCWFAPHNLAIGARIRDAIDLAIRVRDKLLVILSANAIDSEWVESEIETALEEERKDRRTILFPIRIDDDVIGTTRAWARKLRRERHIGNFSGWKDHDAYQKALQRLLHDLAIDSEGSGARFR